jgi:uncharacterized repeat protein (TIGR03803 family)
MRSRQSHVAPRAFFALIWLFLLATALAVQPAHAKTRFKVLHTFHGTPKDGAAPGGQGFLVRDSAGNLYGTTGSGGEQACGKYPCGTAFKLDKNGKEVWVHTFQRKNGLGPDAGLLRDSTGNLYGTTLDGGVTSCGNKIGCGTLFRLDGAGHETVLYKLKGGMSDGWAADSPVARDAAGNLYGTTEYGGPAEAGVIFKVAPDGKETILHSFTAGSDGCTPIGVTLDGSGNLYGVAEEGGGGSTCAEGEGVLFKLDTAGNNFTVLGTFGGSGGAYPDSPLLLDASGNLYGETAEGGNSTGCSDGCGTVFEFSATGQETVLYSFCSLSNCEDGQGPGGGLVRDSAGNLYGITEFGGKYRNCNGDTCGVVFKLAANGTETVLHTFTGGTDGALPAGGPVMDGLGNLYGTASEGGDANCHFNGIPGCGVVFKLTP